MITFKNILVPTDFEAASHRALEVASSIGEKFDAKLILFHAFQLPPTPYVASVAWPIAELQIAARDALDAEVERAKKTYANIESTIGFGYASDLIVDYAERNPVDLIVMGTHGRRGISRLLGSIAARVVRLAAVPVLTVSAPVPE